jgi:hypothetical protein
VPLTVDSATTTFAGSGGTDANCTAVLAAVGAGPGNIPYVTTNCGTPSECFLVVSGPDSQQARCLDAPPNYGASNSFHRRTCACE